MIRSILTGWNQRQTIIDAGEAFGCVTGGVFDYACACANLNDIRAIISPDVIADCGFAGAADVLRLVDACCSA